MKVAVYGNPADGFRIVGPFETSADAQAYIDSERNKSDWWIMDLDAPDQTVYGFIGGSGPRNLPI